MALSSDTGDTGASAGTAQDTPVLQAPIDVRSTALAVLAVLAVLFMLHWARDVFIPLMIAVMLSYALSPLVERLYRLRIPRAFGAALLLLGMAGGCGYAVYALSDDAGRLVDRLPDTAEKLGKALRRQSEESEAAVEKVQRAAEHLERAADETAAARTPDSGVMRVQIQKPAFDWKDFLWAGTRGAVEFFGQFGIVLFLTYFLLISGDTFRRKLVRISGPTLSKKKITLQVLDDIDQQIQRYLFVQVATSALVGILTWLAFMWFGLEHAAILGIAAGALNIVPYLGPVLGTGAAAAVALLQFGTLDMALLIAGVALLINGLEGYLLTPWLTGRANRMSAVVIFVSVLFWGWLWGVWGLLLGVPIVVMIKAVCDRVEDLKPIGELLGD